MSKWNRTRYGDVVISIQARGLVQQCGQVRWTITETPLEENYHAQVTGTENMDTEGDCVGSRRDDSLG